MLPAKMEVSVAVIGRKPLFTCMFHRHQITLIFTLRASLCGSCASSMVKGVQVELRTVRKCDAISPVQFLMYACRCVVPGDEVSRSELSGWFLIIRPLQGLS
jgi:hypothetical protein